MTCQKGVTGATYTEIQTVEFERMNINNAHLLNHVDVKM